MQNACQILLNAEQLNKSPGLRKRVFSFPASHSLACLVSLIKGWGWGLEVRAPGWGALSPCVPGMPPPQGREEAAGVTTTQLVFTALSKGIIKPASGVPTPSFLQKV